MLIFNGKKYAKNDKEFTDSVFTNQTCVGYYKKQRNGTQIFDMQRQLIAYIVANDKQGYFVVSATIDNNNPRYMFGLSSYTADFLGLSLTANESDIVKTAQYI